MKHFAEALDLPLEAISGFQRQPLKSEKTSQVLALKLSEPGSSRYAAQHMSFRAKIKPRRQAQETSRSAPTGNQGQFKAPADFVTPQTAILHRPTIERGLKIYEF